MANGFPKMKRYTIKDFNRDFPNDAACLAWLKMYLYPEGIICKNPKCPRYQQFTQHYRVITRRSYSCAYCGHHVHPTAGTVFHKSSTSLKSWFYAVFLMAQTRCGISAKQLQRELGVTYKTAWRMFRQIRSLLTDKEPASLGGEVEADETYIGGRRRGRRGKPGVDEKMKPVMGVVERKGRVVASVVRTTTAANLLPVIKEHVLPDSIIYTDELLSYGTLSRHGYQHRRIPHSQRVYVMGNVHTNTIEGFWSLVKRGLSGVYHSVSAKHLQSYLDEYSFRYNHRNDYYPMFTTFLAQVALHRVGGLPPAGRPSEGPEDSLLL